MTNLTVISKEDAKARGLKRYFTGKPCNRGHVAERFVSSGVCFECNRVRVKRWCKANPVESAAKAKRWREANAEKAAEWRRRYREVNPEKVAESKRRYREANPEKVAAGVKRWRKANPEKQAMHSRRWQKRNIDRVAAKAAKRRAAKLQRTPEWADLDLIDVFYATSREMTEETGVPHHVDHIIPMQGEIVSGLHVATNLQILTASENTAKGSKYDV